MARTHRLLCTTIPLLGQGEKSPAGRRSSIWLRKRGGQSHPLLWGEFFPI